MIDYLKQAKEHLAAAAALIAVAIAAERQADAAEGTVEILRSFVGNVNGVAVLKTWDDFTATAVAQIAQALYDMKR